MLISPISKIFILFIILLTQKEDIIAEYYDIKT
nr:MAG TPA: hypothetical protein [Caudoviricetes sp.]DAH93330.1 MAG TPA: hypothetical protein [Caudoviricetes sp.]